MSLYGIENMVYSRQYLVCKHKDPTNYDLWNPPSLGPLSQNVAQRVQKHCFSGLSAPRPYLLRILVPDSLILKYLDPLGMRWSGNQGRRLPSTEWVGHRVAPLVTGDNPRQ